MKIAIYPGTFDPITNGHVDIIERASALFDSIIIVIAVNSTKSPLYSEKERKRIIEEVIKEKKFKNVTVELNSGLLVKFAESKSSIAIIRGLRAVSDFEYEFQMALMNRKLSPNISTVFLMPHEKYTYLNSSIVREIASLGGDISGLVPKYVENLLLKKFRKK
ncbi:MAG: pantetheine-phosphate adenylyltransferase [Bacteroidota bacterium]